METRVSANTTCIHSTHLLRGYELIKAANSEYRISSENWPYPTQYRIGTPKDPYYAETWVDGMDWQHNYWIIESNRYETPKIYPLIQFTSHDEEDKFNPYDFKEMIDAILNYRRNIMWLKSEDVSIYGDSIWPYMHRIMGDQHRLPFMIWYHFLHASQREVKFWININFIPKNKRCRKSRIRNKR